MVIVEELHTICTGNAPPHPFMEDGYKLRSAAAKQQVTSISEPSFRAKTCGNGKKRKPDASSLTYVSIALYPADENLRILTFVCVYGTLKKAFPLTRLLGCSFKGS